MNICKYDNSMYCTNPPSIPPQPELSPEEMVEEQINNFLEEERSFLKSEPNRELIKNGKSK